MKKRWQIIANYGIWAALVIALLVSLSFVEHEQEQMRCKSLEVKIEPEADLFFITRDNIVKELTAGKGESTLMGQPVVEFNVGKLENMLELNPFVLNAEVFIDIEGNLRVDVEQRRPVMRVMHHDGSGYYIDENGIKMPLSDSFTAHVPIATGNIYEKLEKTRDTVFSKAGRDVYRLGLYLDKNPFWMAMIEQVEVNAKGELVFIPKIADHLVVLGNAEGLDEKLTHLKIFYKKGLNKLGWDKYKVINLKYTGQIVCEKW
jgi:cell division protein FtsQ